MHDALEHMTAMPTPDDSRLIDVLPTGDRVHASRELVLPLPEGTQAAVVDGTMLRALCAALAWAEWRLTGVDRIVVATLGGGRLLQATIDAAGIASAQAWCDASDGALALARDGDDATAMPTWAIATDAAAVETSPRHAAVSVWRLDESEHALRVTYAAPLGARGARLLAAMVLSALPAMLRRDASSLDAIAGDIAQADFVKADSNETDSSESTSSVSHRADDAGRGSPANAATPEPIIGNVHSRFASMLMQHAQGAAAADAHGELSYAQLDIASDAIAHRLRDAGVVAGAIVGVAMSRSRLAIAALLGVLKAGAAYLPLDAAQPAERVAFLLRDAGVRVVLRDDAHDDLALPDGVMTLQVDAATLSDTARGAFAAPMLDADALAYVMYTSGSTGVPKGVEIRHRSILRLVCDVDYIALGPQTRMLHAAPLGFDAATLELWGPLLNGGCVVVHDEAVPTGAGLAQTIAARNVDTAWLTAALFNAIVDDDPRQLAGLRALYTGGEALSVDHVRRMQRSAPGTVLHNGYGPTECTTFTTTYRIPDELPADATSVPIGRPIARTQVHVLNARRQPLPAGVLGELYVGGDGLARGYLGRHDLTAERFVADPFSASGNVLYRTGDLVRRRADGVIDFVGRVDDQVKIRGYRIEPGEIEAVLAVHPSVASCAVLARADRPGERQLVAYVVLHGASPGEPALRAFLAASLPDFMVPARYVLLDALPVTANGKLDRRALPAPGRARPELAVAWEPPRGAIEHGVCDVFAELLDLEQVGRHDGFFDLGGTSLLATRAVERLRTQLAGQRVPVTLLFSHPTPALLAAALAARDGAASARDAAAHAASATPKRANRDDPIAIIAMAGRFPGARDVEAFWDNLSEGRDTIRVFQPDELDASVSAADRSNPDYVAARGVVDDVDQFDAAFFGIGAREAELMDPQQRIFLELCWECMERGGHVPGGTTHGDATGTVGIFAGMYNASYFQRHVSAHPELVDKVGAFQVMLGNEKDYIATRVAHKLHLTGPAVSVHTACSTSLVAIVQAMDSLRAGRCRMALAGGASLTCPPNSGYVYQEGSMLSPDGRTRTFAADSQGTVFSDGAAVVLLKRLSDALADGDEVVALIRGGAINNDGGEKASFTAPSSIGQADVVAMAHDDAGVDARSIGYVEAHGTATPLGDPIEIEGLTQAFRRATKDVGFCRIGSVKSNIGHTVIAAGATGVIKTALALREQRIPASLHCDVPNPALELDASPFVVNSASTAWPMSDTPRRAGVSSFGVGGTNAHVVMEEAPLRAASHVATGAQLLVLSARTPTALAAAAARLADHLEATPDINLADVAWTLGVGRKAFAHRAACVSDDVASAIAALRGADMAAATRGKPARHADVVFLFPGQGAQYAGMGRALYASEPAFAAAFDACADAAREELGFDLRDVVFGDDGDALLPTAVQQPATFAIEYALATLWMHLGVQPVAMVGHSVGEFVAATLAGVFALPDALRLVARRGALMQAQPAGGMLSVRAPFPAMAQRLPGDLSLAAENSPGSCVVAGPLTSLAALQSQLEGEGIACRALRTSHAFHSAMMDAVVAPFRAEVDAVARHAPTIPIVSTVSGDWLDAASATSADYWARHLREPVRFAPALERVLGDGARVLLEVGPRATLATLARQHPAVQASAAGVVASLGDAPEREDASVRAALGQLWSRGAEVDPTAFDRRAARRRVRLPSYPFERQRYWVETGAARSAISTLARPLPTGVPAAIAPIADAIVAVIPSPAPVVTMDRKPRIVAQLKDVFEDVAGFDLADADPDTNFIELGLDSLMLTQVALQLQKTFAAKITFRQLMGECASLDRLAERLDREMPADVQAAVAQAPTAAAPTPGIAYAPVAALSMPSAGLGGQDYVRNLIDQQMQLMAQQLALLTGASAPATIAAALPAHAVAHAPAPVIDTAAPASASTATQAALIAQPSAPAAAAPGALADDESAIVHTSYDVKKAFGAIARIDSAGGTALEAKQKRTLDAFIARYVARTAKSKAYTQQHRPHMADPRVVNGFKPMLKEMIYQIVIERSKGAHLWDIDGNEYVDALNGFGMSLFGWQPDFVLDAIRTQLDLGYEIGPQHPLAGEVAKLACEVTGHDRAALCNTGSEAVLGALRIARTVTGRETVVLFTGAYHGIIDEMIVRGTKKLRAVPAAPGILRNTAEHVLVLEYGTDESLQIIRERAGEIAAVLVEPVQSRRPDFRPVEFLRELRTITSDSGALLVFDEVVTGFRAHPGGAQALFGIQADLATYGKVVGGGYPIGVIAGKRTYMDALDGGHWQYGDDSVPTVGVTYFAGTFVRHPLALAAAKAVLEHIRDAGPALQATLNARAEAMADELNAFCSEAGAPISVKQFASVWKTQFLEDHPMQDLLFAMMRSRGIHILDNFPCFLTTAHSEADFRAIIDAFKASVTELQEAGFLPRRTATPKTVMDAGKPSVAGARLGRDPDGRPAWYVPNPDAPGQYLKVG